MTSKDFFIKMNEIKAHFEHDQEIAHSLMDEVMEELLIELGYEKGIEVFRSQDKWYA